MTSPDSLSSKCASVKIRQTTNYDCHIVSLRQVLADDLYFPYVFYGALFNLQPLHGSIACHHVLDSELAREYLLADMFDVHKICLLLDNAITQNLIQTLAEQGYCICRLDTAYMPSFKNYVGQWDRFKRILAHKIVLLELTEDKCQYIDNVNLPLTQLYTMPTQEFLQAICSGILARYDKADYAYYYKINSSTVSIKAQKIIRDRFKEFLRQQAEFGSILKQLLDKGTELLYLDMVEVRLGQLFTDQRTAWINNLILSSSKIDLCYQLLVEAFNTCQRWVLDNDSYAQIFFEYIKKSASYWGHIRLLAQRNLYYCNKIEENVLSAIETIYQFEICACKQLQALRLANALVF